MLKRFVLFAIAISSLTLELLSASKTSSTVNNLLRSIRRCTDFGDGKDAATTLYVYAL